MATTVQKSPDLEARSKAFAALFADVGLEAREQLAKKCVDAAKKVTDLIDLQQSYDLDLESGALVPKVDPKIAKLQLDAAKLTLQLNSIGADEDKKPSVVINITNTQAVRISEGAALSEGF